jgi:signal peptidase II
MNTSMNLPQRLSWSGVTALLCIGLDQSTKAVAKAHLTLSDSHSLLGDTVRLQLDHNTGAFLGLGDSLPESLRMLVFSVGVGALLIGLLIYALGSKSIDRMTTVALALIFAGGASNLFDRIAYGGYVVDFLYVHVGPLHTGIFNVADMAIMAGAFLMLADAFRRDRAAKSKQ